MPPKILSVEFIKSAEQPQHFLPSDAPEIAFAGRSNVGKSSLLNTMAQRKSLARTSKTPGKTRLINFFEVNLEKVSLRLVDLPGYGYSKGGKAKTQGWAPLIEKYLTNRANLKLACSLIDCRHKPSQMDIQLLEWFQHTDVPHIIILTKSDKLSRQALSKNIKMIRQSLGLANCAELIPFSALKKTGREELWKAIMNSL